MQSHFDVSSVNSSVPPSTGSTGEISVDLLRQILEVQRQILSQLQATAAAQDATVRWRSLLARWSTEFPELPQACRDALPILERSYGSIISNLVDELRQNSDDGLDNEFTLQEFLDRYGIRLGQLGNILNLVGPLAEASSQKESS